MSDPAHDILDRRGRLRRLGVSLAIGVAVTTLAMLGMAAASRAPSADPVGQIIPVLLAMAILVVTSKLAHEGLERLRRRPR